MEQVNGVFGEGGAKQQRGSEALKGRSGPHDLRSESIIRPVGGDWASAVAGEVERKFPGLSEYTCAAGISPSGVVHFGNFRDVMTSHLVASALRERGLNAKLLFSWDDYDRLRKVPEGLSLSLSRYIGMPLSEVPDPLGELPSYAARFEGEFERAMEMLDIKLEYRYQSAEYKSGRYAPGIIEALNKRKEIAAILLSYMSEKGIREKSIDPVEFQEKFFPIAVYSHFNGKDNTTVLDFDGKSRITYLCRDSREERTFDLLQDPRVKLAWKIDWPMRWGVEQVVFEPGGSDHAAPGGSFDVSAKIAHGIFGRQAPHFVGYEFIGLGADSGKGTTSKMSSSRGTAVSPLELLNIYEPSLLKWIYAHKEPSRSFSLSFGTEMIRQYDEFDREVTSFHEGTLPLNRQKALLQSVSSEELGRSAKPIPFRQAEALGQILQWSVERVCAFNERAKMGFSEESIATRLPCARRWLEMYNPEKLIVVRSESNSEYAKSMSPEGLSHVAQLREALASELADVEQLEKFVYSIPKLSSLGDSENKIRQRAFFKDVYNLIISRDTGPRLSTFLSALDRATVMNLLDCSRR